MPPGSSISSAKLMSAAEQFLDRTHHGSPRHAQELLPHLPTLAKWCAGALVLVLPGSFVVLVLLWLYRRRAPSFSMRLKRAVIVLAGMAVAFTLLIATDVCRWMWNSVAHVGNFVYQRYGIDLPLALVLFGVGELLFCGSIAMMLKEAGEKITWRGVRLFRIRDLNLGSRRMMGWLWLNRLSWIVPWLVVIAMSIGRVPWWATAVALGEVGATLSLGIFVSLGLQLMMGKEHRQCNR